MDAHKVARETGMGGRINTIMQTCFFAISGVLPREQAIQEIKHSIKKTYGKRGEAVVQRNYEAVDQTLAHLYEVDLRHLTTDDRRWTMDNSESFAAADSSSIVHRLSSLGRRPPVSNEAPE